MALPLLHTWRITSRTDWLTFYVVASPDRSSRFTDGSCGVLYVRNRFETAVFETIHYYARFKARTREAAGCTARFREIILSIDADIHDLTSEKPEFIHELNPDSYAASQVLATDLKRAGSGGIG